MSDAASPANVMMVLSGMSDEAQMEDNISYMAKFQPLNEDEPLVVYIVHAQPLQLTVEEGREIRSIPDHEQGQLIRNGIGHAGIPLDHSGFILL